MSSTQCSRLAATSRLASIALAVLLPSMAGAEAAIQASGVFVSEGVTSTQACPNCLTASSGVMVFDWTCSAIDAGGVYELSCGTTSSADLPAGAVVNSFYLSAISGSGEGLLSELTLTHGLTWTVVQNSAAGGGVVHNASNPITFSGAGRPAAAGLWTIGGRGRWSATSTMSVQITAHWGVDAQPPPAPVPAPPTALNASPGLCAVDISWNPNGGANVSETWVEIAYEGGLSGTFGKYELNRLSGAPGSAHFEGQRFCRPVRIRLRTFMAQGTGGAGVGSLYSNVVESRPVVVAAPVLNIANDGEALLLSFDTYPGTEIHLDRWEGSIAARTSYFVGRYIVSAPRSSYRDTAVVPAVQYFYQASRYRRFSDGSTALLGASYPLWGESNIVTGIPFGAWFIPAFLAP